MLKDKSVVITGSAKGIGRYIAHGFAKEGAKVAIADIDETRLQQTLGELGELGAETMAVPTDVRSEDAVAALMAQVNERFGGIDVLINDAAIVPHFNWNDKPRWPKIQDMDASFFWDTVMGVALRGSFLASKHAVPYMEARRRREHREPARRRRPHTARRTRLRDGEGLAHHVHEVPRGRGARLQHLPSSSSRRARPSRRRTRRRRPATGCPGRTTPESASCSAAEASMELSGHLLDLEDGQLVVLR